MGYRKRTNKITDEIIEEMPESMPESVPEPVPENTQDITPNYTEMDETARRKQEIADKRRASLALARSKIVPKSALKKQADEVIKSKDIELKNKQEETDAMRLKYERDRVKQLEDNLMTLQKLIAEKPAPVVVPVVEVPSGTRPTMRAEPVVVPVVEPPKRKQRPSRSKEALAARAVETEQVQQPKLIIPKKSVDSRMLSREAPPSTEKLIDKSYSEQLQERLRTQAINKIMNDTFGGF